ncbi:hypothetical protein ACFWNU_25695, partial [Streptomyces sp. NPDC058427]|uniref:hypothetical protein n=1 Tax=Streptomyces sp. NPDC058427 TaxID=3346494 RepID=UPI0036624837
LNHQGLVAQIPPYEYAHPEDLAAVQPGGRTWSARRSYEARNRGIGRAEDFETPNSGASCRNVRLVRQ